MINKSKKLLNLLLKIMLVTFSFSVISISAVSYSVQDFLKNIQVNTTLYPKAFVRWNTILSGVRGCYWIDLSRVDKTPIVDWTSAQNFIYGYLIPIFGNPELTKEEQEFCFGDWPKFSWTVATNGTRLDRPVYSAKAWFEGKLWREEARIKVGTACETEEVRKTTYSYHYVTANNGKRGLVACNITAIP